VAVISLSEAQVIEFSVLGIRFADKLRVTTWRRTSVQLRRTRKTVKSKARLTDNRFEEIRLEWQQIARSEVSRQQRKLAFTAEQQLEVESALVAVTDGLFERLLGNVSSAAQLTCLKIWRRDEMVVS
jgi:hypothetical protein